MKIQELLKTWSELEPNRCKASFRLDCFVVKINNLEHDIFFPENSQRIKDDSTALAFKAAMQAIEESELLLNLENDGQVWHSSLADLTITPPSESLPIVPRFLAAEVSHEIAVVRSYVLWLEHKRDDAAKVEKAEEAAEEKIGGES